MSGDLDRVSLTIGEDLLTELDEVIDEWEYASRSEAIRDALRDLLAEYRWRTDLTGDQRGSIVVVHDHHVAGVTNAILDIQHDMRDVITSVQHVHLSEHLCMETLVIDGSGSEVRTLMNRLQSIHGVRQVKLALVGE